MRAQQPFDTTAYRYPGEHLRLAVTILSVLAVIALTATATVCLSAVFVVATVLFAYGRNRSHHRTLVAQAQRVTSQQTPGLARILAETQARLQPGTTLVYVSPQRGLNAYTFGLHSPKVVVLHSLLLQLMDEDEMRFVLGHELGHVRLGHTWLNSLVGGMAGIPSPFALSGLLAMAFLWWNRACEHSADRAGLLACGSHEKAISALLKLAVGSSLRSPGDIDRALRRLDAEDDHALADLSEALCTHPSMMRRIGMLRAYAASKAYARLQGLVDRNVPRGEKDQTGGPGLH
jgi:Zn-dependent protease with chaperone function